MRKYVYALIYLAVLWGLAAACEARGSDWIEPPEYKQAYEMARDKDKPLVILVGIPPRKIVGCVSIDLPDYYGNDAPRIIVGTPGRVGAVLSAGSSDARILAYAFPKAVSQPAAPFELLAGPDDDEAAQLVPIIAELEPYQRATMTQQSFRRWSGVIHPFSRTRVLAKWQHPGGLEGMQGWSSRLYRTRGMQVQAFLTRQDPSNSVSAVTWWQNYPDGSVFADVLRNSAGVVFEVRVAEKSGNTWDRFVAYKNVRARPHEYTMPIRSECRSCHAGAGLSEYAEAANPGADETISHPIGPLERGHSVQGGYGERL